MVTEKDITGGEKIPDEFKSNLKELLEKVLKLEKLYGKPFKITSGFRTMAHHIKVYKDKGITDPAKIPMKSKHLFCQAVDIYDPKFELTKFCKEHTKEMEEIGIWFEDDMSVPRLHVQIVPPGSKVRWFKIK